MEKKEYCTPVVWGAVAFMFFGAGLMYYWYITGVTVPSRSSPSYNLGMMFIFLFGAACTGTSCRLTETDITFRLFGIPFQKKSWSRVCRIVYFHPRYKSETFSELYSTCLILYKDFPRYPQKDKTSWDDFLLLLFQLRHPGSVHSIQVPNKTRGEFLTAIKDLSRLPVEEILPGAPRKPQSPPPSGESRQVEPEKQPKQHKLLICLLFGFTGLNGLCFGLSQGDAAIRWVMIGAAALMALGIVLYCLVLSRQVNDRDLAIQGALVFALLSGLFLYLTFSWWFLAVLLAELAVLGIALVLQRRDKMK